MTLETQQSMGMSSVTQAPRWPEASLVTRRIPALAAGRPAQLALVSADASQLIVEGRRPVLAPLLLSPLLTCLGALPWVAPEPLSGIRLAVSGVFFLAAAGLARWGWPRRRRLTLSSKRPASPGTVAVPPGSFRWVLEMRHAPNASHATYAVALEPNEGSPVGVLESTDPEGVLWQLSEVLRYWPGPIDCRWGLPAGVQPWNIEPLSGPRSLAADGTPERVVAAPANRSLIWCARSMAAFVVADLVFLVGSAGIPWRDVHPLSLLLPLLFAACLVALVVALQTARSRLLIAGRVRREDGLFGLCKQHGSLRLESVRGVYTLGAPSADRWHVLIDSSDGPLSLSVPRHAAAALASQVEQAVAAVRGAGH